MNFKDRAKKHVTEKNLAWEDYLIDCAHAGYNVKNSVTNRSMFMNGYHAGKENTASLEAQLAQAEDFCNQLQIEQKVSAAEQWISVSEELPKTSGIFYVTFHNGTVGRSAFYVGAFDAPVIAWMPLPKPYTESAL